MKRYKNLCITILISITLIFFSLKYSPSLFDFPFIIIFLSICIIFLNVFFVLKLNQVRIIAFNIFLLFLGLAILEGYFYIKFHPHAKYISLNGKPYQQDDELLSFKPVSNNTTQFEFVYDDKTLSVTYSIDQNGLRKTPRGPQNNSDAILFFGDSVTFGWGVNDDENFPYLIGSKLKGKYKIFNFAFEGYGTHQMYTQINSGIVNNIVGLHNPVLGIYVADAVHVKCLLGQNFYNRNDPRYILKKNKLIKKGTFNSNSILRRFASAIQLGKSFLFVELFNRINKNITEKDIDLFVELIKQSEIELKAKWPTIRFIVLTNNMPNHYYSALKEAGLETYRLSDYISDIETNREKYKFDYWHPTPFGHQVISDVIYKEFINKH